MIRCMNMPINYFFFAALQSRFSCTCIRGPSDKYLASPSDGVTIAREINYRVVHFRRLLLSKFQPNRTRSFVLTACGIGRVRGFYEKWGKSNIGRDSILVFGREIAQRNQRTLGCYGAAVTLLLRWRSSKIGLTSFNVVALRFLMSP